MLPIPPPPHGDLQNSVVINAVTDTKHNTSAQQNATLTKPSNFLSQNTINTTMANNLEFDNNHQQINVSSGNPCPFLRMLVAQGQLPDGEAPISEVQQAIQRVVDVRDRPQTMPTGFNAGIKLVASTGNGITPKQIRHNLQQGVHLDKLRYHIFDKRGNGSRLLDENAKYVSSEMARLITFASMKLENDGTSELGLNEQEIKAMLHANFERATGSRRHFDRALMEGEFPILLKVIGKQGKNERYLSVVDIERLFKKRRLPERMETRLANINHQP